jgi:hypothetical protein
VATSVVIVPLIAAFSLNVAKSIPDRDPLLDGFGLVNAGFSDANRDCVDLGKDHGNEEEDARKEAKMQFKLGQRDIILLVVEEHLSRDILAAVAGAGEFETRPRQWNRWRRR